MLDFRLCRLVQGSTAVLSCPAEAVACLALPPAGLSKAMDLAE